MTEQTAPRRGRLVAVVVAALVTLAALVVGWSATGTAPRYDQVRVDAPAASAKPESKPVAVDIPSIGARSSLVELGLNPDRTLQVPPVSQPMQAGWYAKGPTPGEPGPAVIAGHVDGRGQKGVFHRLHELQPGDAVDVQREDGSTARFAVQRVAQVPKKGFPGQQVYGATPDAQLRVITCGGSFDPQAHSYTDNVVVFAKLVE
ncbi:class F sortase [Saccharopolyspora subtropica]|uniref:Class F sortase n=1 Tax=Saccharopolyspora thermophila TaxID=89367 RepID=A0A917NAR5_9PSEU|nr:class F sortase [Saccharopolyspora subtropica]GGI83453.1 class F sortase [Saccharopolyspora subtropica]